MNDRQDLLDDTKKDFINAACEMYRTACNLNMSGLTVDANSIATKAKLLLNRALENVIPSNSDTN